MNLDLDALAHRVATAGPGHAGPGLVAFVRRARAADVSPALLDLVLDPDKPTVVRQRAFGLAAAAFVAAATRTDELADAA